MNLVPGNQIHKIGVRGRSFGILVPGNQNAKTLGDVTHRFPTAPQPPRPPPSPPVIPGATVSRVQSGSTAHRHQAPRSPCPPTLPLASPPIVAPRGDLTVTPSPWVSYNLLLLCGIVSYSLCR